MKIVLTLLLLLLLIGSVFAYVAPTTANQPIVVESDSAFYGSDLGIVTIDLNLTSINPSSKDFFVRIIGLEDTNVLVKELSFNKVKIESIAYPVSQQSKTKISLDALEKKPMQIVLQFNPSEIKVGKEFIIRLETKDGTLVADLDPFLSGYNYRQQWCLNTDGISLTGDVTTDLSIVFVKTSADTAFWANVDSTGKDVRFTDASNNLYYYYFQDWNYTTKSMITRAKVTQTFTSASDTCGYMYYSNAGASDGQSKANSFGANEVAYWNFDETTGDLLDQIASANGTNSGLTQGSSGEIKNAYTYAGTHYTSVAHASLNVYGVISATAWVYPTTFANDEGMIYSKASGGSVIQYRLTDQEWSKTDGKPQFYVGSSGGDTSITCSSAMNLNAWNMVVGTWTGDNSANGLKIYLNGSNCGEKAWTNGTQDASSNPMYFGKNNSTGNAGFTGRLDEVGIFNAVLSADAIKVLYNSELKTLASFSAQESGNNAPDINMTSPTTDLNWNGTKNITFNILDLDKANTLDVNLYYSSTAGARTNLIYHDANLADGSGITCSDYNFLDSTACTYSWDTTTASDGLYYIDGNVWDGSTTDQSSTARFRVDNTKPVTTFSGCTTAWHNSAQTITLSCADTDGSGCNGTTYSIDGGSTTVYSGTFLINSDGNHSIDYNSIDLATNVEVTKRNYCAYDATPPTVASPLFVGFTIFGGFINGVGTFLGGLATDVLSGIDQATCEYTINGGGAWLSAVWNTDHCEATGVAIVDGTDYNIGTRVDDQAGNTGTSDYNGVYVGDANAPQTTDNASNDWSASNETVTLSCADPAGAGCKQTFYCVDTLGTCTPTTVGTSVSVTCTAGNVCEQYVRYFSQDNVDNNETAHNSVLTRIDKQNPTATSIEIIDDAGRTEDIQPDLTISATDGSGSGLKEMAFSCNGSTWSSWFTYDTTYNAFDLTTGAGCTANYGAKTVYLKVRDNVDNESTSTSDSTILDATVIYGDLNLFTVGNYTSNADLTIFSDVNIQWQFTATSNDLNAKTAKVYYQSPFNDSNCSGYIRDNVVCGFQTDDYVFSIQSLVGTTFTLRSATEDDHAFKPYSYNLDPDDFKTKSATPIVLNSSNVWGQTLLSSVRTDRNVFYNLSFFANFTGATSRNLIVYDCNSSVITPVANANCNSYVFSSSSLIDLDGYYSIKGISNDQNYLDNKKLNADGNHWVYWNCPTCTPTQYWSLGMIDQNSNLDKVRNQTSTTGVENLAPNAKTIDSHFHFLYLERNNVFSSYFEVDNNQGKTYTSSVYEEIINQVNLPPQINEIISPVENVYSGFIDVNILVDDPDGDTIVCDVNLNSLAHSTIAQLATDLSPVENICSFDFNSALYADENYYLKITVRETETYEEYFTSVNSDNFRIQNEVNDPPTVTVVQPNGGEVYTKLVDTPTVIFTLQDPDNNTLYIDLNYSSTDEVGTGTQLLIQENVLTSGHIICDSGNFSSDVNCSYIWDIEGVEDGNYFIVMAVSDGLLDTNDVSDSQFEIVSLPPIPPSTDYVERYIAPTSTQRDTNIYFNPTSAFALSETQQQNLTLKTIENNIFLFGVIIILIIGFIGWFLWKRK